MILRDRRKTVSSFVGGVPIGSGHPIVVQSMTNTDTADPVSTAEQVVALANAGSQLVRITVNNDEAATAVPEIMQHSQGRFRGQHVARALNSLRNNLIMPAS